MCHGEGEQFFNSLTSLAPPGICLAVDLSSPITLAVWANV